MKTPNPSVNADVLHAGAAPDAVGRRFVVHVMQTSTHVL